MKDRDITRNYHGGADTSEQAFNETPKAIRYQIRMRVLSAIRDAGDHGLTCDELETKTGIAHQSASARITELKEGLLIRDKGERRRTKNGRLARVYVVR